MRTIKFRAKRSDTGEWVYGDLIHRNDGDVAIYTNLDTWAENQDDVDAYGDSFRVDNSTVGQFIGILDKNGKEIYEGDIVEYTTCYFGNEKRHRKVVEWESFDSDDFGEPHNIGYFNLSEYMEVIGNIYDNPELLNK